ncbi:MAG: hypothetical protein ACXV4B_08040 [Halobacteriota archaeon]
MFLIVLPLLAVLLSAPALLLFYVLDVPVVLVPVLVRAQGRGEIRKALASVPSFLVLRIINALFVLEALGGEVVLRKRLHTWEKGH